MKPGIKIALWILILIGIAYLFYKIYEWGKGAVDKVTFNVTSGSTIRDAISSISGGTANADMILTIDNKNGFTIPVSGLYIEVFYNGDIVAKSTVTQDAFVIPANGTIDVTHNVTLILSKSDLTIAKALLMKQTIKFDYTVRVTVYGIPLPLIRQTFNT